MNRRRLAFKAASVVLAASGAFAIAEVAVRIARPDEPGQIQNGGSGDVLSGGRLPEGTRDGLHVNRLGFRDDEDFPEAKPAGEKRVLFIGDSFLYGANLRLGDLVPRRCEERLRAGLGAPLRAIDLSCPGWGTRHELAAFHNFGVPLQPDATVLCFFVGNDVCETYECEHAGDADTNVSVALDKNRELYAKVRRTRIHMRVLQCSKLFRLWQSTALYGKLASLGQPSSPTPDAAFREEAYWRCEHLRFEQWRRGASAKPLLDEAWRLVARHFESLVQEMRAAGTKPVVLVIPDEVQVDGLKRAELCRRFGLDEKDFDLEEPQRRLAELAARHGVPCVDVLPAFREKGSRGGLYFDLDTHWNAKGHDLAAEVLAPVLERLLRT